jgi:hypothetical protein
MGQALVSSGADLAIVDLNSKPLCHQNRFTVEGIFTV